MTGSFERVHPHTLGMVAAASSIEKQLALRRAWEAAQLSDQHKALMMESMSDGVVTLDREGFVTHLNQKSMELLRLANRELLLGRPVWEELPITRGNDEYAQLRKIIDAGREVTDEVITMMTSGITSRLTVTTRRMRYTEGQPARMVVILQEIARVNRLIQQMIGASARARFEDLIGQDPQFLASIHLGATSSQSACNVLLLGESGTGKDILA